MNPVERLANLYPEYQRPRNILRLAQVLGLIEEYPNLSPQRYCALADISNASFNRYKRELHHLGLINNKLIVTYKAEVKLVKETPKPELKLVKEEPTPDQPVVAPTTGLVFDAHFWKKLQDNPLAQYVITIAQSPPGTIFFEDEREGMDRDTILKTISNALKVDTFLDLFAMYSVFLCLNQMKSLKSLKEESIFNLRDLESLLKPYRD